MLDKVTYKLLKRLYRSGEMTESDVSAITYQPPPSMLQKLSSKSYGACWKKSLPKLQKGNSFSHLISTGSLISLFEIGRAHV